jgi:peptidoglycan hydrolase-like protein with peptidoglycan-binding domain
VVETSTDSAPGVQGKDFVALPIGTAVGRYTIAAVLGRGGFGITYRARDTELDRDVALKEYLPSALSVRHDGVTVLPSSTEVAEDFTWGRQRFVEEGRTLATLERAPAIVRLLDYLETNGTAYIVMELLSGETLEKRLQRGPLMAEEIDRILWPLLDGLEQVHEAGFLHRDIKPANILLDAAGNPTLIDFGASRAAMVGRTAAMTAVFTPGYAAAEQMTSSRQGPWTDIYGLSATLYHAVTGAAPPSAFDRMIDDECAPLLGLAPAGFSPGLLAGLDAGLGVRAPDRPQSIADWRTALRQTDPYGAATIAVRRPTRTAEADAPPLRRTALWATLAVAAVALVAGGAYFARPLFQEAKKEAAAVESDIERRAREMLAEAQAERRKAYEMVAAEKAEMAAREKAIEGARAKAEADAREKAEAEAKAKADAEEKARADAEAQRKAYEEAAADKKAAEALENGLKLALLDRQHLQIALTAAGFDTHGSDGAFGPRSREMIAAWQKANKQQPTGFLTAAEQQTLLKSGAAAIQKFDDDQKKIEDDKKKAEDDARKKKVEDGAKSKAAAGAAPPASPAPPGADSGAFSSAYLPGALSRVAKAGTETMIGIHSNWDPRTCDTLPPPTLRLVTPPKNGFVAIRRAPDTVTCGRTIQGTAVYYTPNPGFVGTDTFSYERLKDPFVPPKAVGVRNVTVRVTP